MLYWWHCSQTFFLNRSNKWLSRIIITYSILSFRQSMMMVMMIGAISWDFIVGLMIVRIQRRNWTCLYISQTIQWIKQLVTNVSRRWSIGKAGLTNRFNACISPRDVSFEKVIITWMLLIFSVLTEIPSEQLDCHWPRWKIACRGYSIAFSSSSEREGSFLVVVEVEVIIIEQNFLDEPKKN